MEELEEALDILVGGLPHHDQAGSLGSLGWGRGAPRLGRELHALVPARASLPH